MSINRVPVGVLNMWIDSHVPLAHVRHEREGRRLMMCAARLEERQETTFDFLLTTNRWRIKIEAFVARFEDARPGGKKRLSSSMSGNKHVSLGRGKKGRSVPISSRKYKRFILRAIVDRIKYSNLKGNHFKDPQD